MSFLSVEPQSRVFLENYSNTLLAQFDSQSSIIANRYLDFFRERRDIEATYVNSLRRLHNKAKTIDASFDPRAEPSTTRAAWEKVRDNLEKGPIAFAEANAQQAFVDILDTGVIAPLTTLKETNDEIRERIDDDLKKSAAEYADHAEKKISRLQAGIQTNRFRGQQDDSEEPETAKSKDVSDNDFRSAVRVLNSYRLRRAENLGDGYDCLEEFVFAPITKNIIVRYMDGMITASAKYNNLAMSTREEVEKVLARRDTSESNLRASFRRMLSVSIPPLAFYRNYCPGAHSDAGLIFGEHLVDVETDQDNVPKVMRLCMEEVAKRGLDAKGIYSTGYLLSEQVLQLRQRVESEQPFSFRSTDNIHTVAMLLRRYLLDLPEPLFVLSLKDYRNYKQIRARYAENDFSLLRTKIRELHPIHRASLRALLRHLLRVASYSDMNAMTVELAARFSYAVLRGNDVLQDGVHIKCLVLEDLIRNVHTLFDGQPSPVAGKRSMFDNFDSGSLFSGVSSVIPTSTESSISSSPSGVAWERCLTPPPTTLPSTLLRHPLSNTLVEGVEMSSQKQEMYEMRRIRAVAPMALANSPHLDSEVASIPPTPPEAVTVPQGSPESMLSSTPYLL
ncbi:hypothetical protein V8E53_002177 [Lactarius tabidus]